MSTRTTRRMDSKGLRILRANEYKLATAASTCQPSASHGPAATCGEAAPPVLIGGCIGKNIGKLDIGERKAALTVDGIRGTVPFEKLDCLIQYFKQICQVNPEHRDYSQNKYQVSAIFEPFGITIEWDVDEKRRKQHKNRILLTMSGSSLSGFPADSLFKLIQDLHFKFWFKGTRSDLAFDDYQKIIRPSEVNEFAKQGSYKGFGVHEFREGSKKSGESEGATIYFGKRGKNGSGKFLRFYDKDIESKGEIDAVRWEVEFTKQKAQKVLFELAMSEDLQEFSIKIGAFIGGAIDFVEQSDCGKYNPIDRLAFWEQILHHLGAAVLRCPRPDGSIETTMEWIRTSVSPAIAKLIQAMGKELFFGELSKYTGSVKLTERAQSQIRVYHYINGEPSPF